MSLHIHDLSGRLIKSLPFNHLTIQPFNHVSWDGTDASGKQADSGVYFVRTKGYLPTKIIKL
jgi:flagellar hook assembly protein FlgD